MTTIHHRQWRKLRDRVVREEPNCWLRLDGCTVVSTTADHVIPRSHRPDLCMVRLNLRGACENCNLRRGNKTMAELRATMERAKAGPPALRFFG
jgi:5-methylcytosine-specific restriction endonuclease McrA